MNGFDHARALVLHGLVSFGTYVLVHVQERALYILDACERRLAHRERVPLLASIDACDELRTFAATDWPPDLAAAKAIVVYVLALFDQTFADT